MTIVNNQVPQSIAVKCFPVKTFYIYRTILKAKIEHTSSKKNTKHIKPDSPEN